MVGLPDQFRGKPRRGAAAENVLPLVPWGIKAWASGTASSTARSAAERLRRLATRRGNRNGAADHDAVAATGRRSHLATSTLGTRAGDEARGICMGHGAKSLNGPAAR